jgi:hypothetical protein
MTEAAPAAVVTTPAASPAAAPAAVVTTPAANAPAWHGVPETDTAGLEYIKNKGWTGPQDVVKSYQGAEKLIGRDPNTLLAIPRADDPAAFRAAMGRLGMPETPDKYDFGPAAGGAKRDAGFETWAKTTFHEAGLTAAQAKATVAAYEKYGADQAAKQAGDYKLGVAAAKAELQNEWRGGFERQMNAASTAIRALGFTAEMVDGLEAAIGYGPTVKLFAGLGKKLGEDGFVSGTSQPGFEGTMTPAEAKSAWEAMKLDPNTMAALKDKMHPGNKAAVEKQGRLFRIMHPEG